MAVLKIENISYTYSRGTPFEHQALTEISTEIGPGECIFLLGHTGSGKSTFVQHLNALLKPDSGRVLLDGEDINRDRFSRRDVKQKVGLVFQYPEYQLFEETVFRDIAFGPKNMKLPEAEIEQRVREAAAFSGVEEELFERSPLELSGGQKRRIAIAGVIAMRPEVLILDEPTAGLDPAGSRQIMSNILSYRKASGSTVIIVSHDMDDAASFAERLLVFDHGRLFADGTPEQFFSRTDEIARIGLNVPRATELAERLREKGLPLEGPIFTHEQLLQAVLRLKEARTC